jgi:probable F420-dependent oxidoreductase
MDFGVFLPVSGRACAREGLMGAAREAEALGFSTVWAADRIVVPWEIRTPYSYSWTGQFIVPPDKPFLESMTALAFLAGCTERVRLGVSVLVMGYRDPVHWAKVASTIDWLSRGRLVLGVGVGWMAEEFEALGRADLYPERGAVGDEQLEVLRNLFSEDRCTYRGRRYSYEDIAFYPKGFDPDHPLPVWCGGESRAAQRRAGRYGDAWFPYFARITPGELGARFANVRRHAEEAGRDPGQLRLNCCLPVEVTAEPVAVEPDRVRGTPDQVAAALERFAEVGVGHVALQFLVGRYPERLAQMRLFSEEVMGGCQ